MAPPTAALKHVQGFISESKAMDKPFMLYFNPTTPHDPDVYTALFNFTLLDTPAGKIEVSSAVSPCHGACILLLLQEGGQNSANRLLT